MFPNCDKLLLSGVENITAFGAFSLVEEVQVYGGSYLTFICFNITLSFFTFIVVCGFIFDVASYDTTELQNILLANKIEKLTLEHVTPDDEGEVPLVIKSHTLESFTSSKEEFDILFFSHLFISEEIV